MTEGEVLGSTMENQEKLSEGSVKTLETNETSTRINGVEPNQDQISLICGIMKRAEEEKDKREKMLEKAQQDQVSLIWLIVKRAEEEKEQAKTLQERVEKDKNEMQLFLEKAEEEKEKMKKMLERTHGGEE